MSDQDRIVADFIAQREEYVRVLEQCVNANADYHRWQGHAEARRQLRDKLAAAAPQAGGGAALPVRTDGGGNPAAASSSPQPVDREALVELMDLHRIEAFNGSQVVCECDLTWVTSAEHRAHLADAVLALLNGGQANG